MKMKSSYKLSLGLLIAGAAALSSGCTGGGSSSYSVYGGYGYPYYGNDWGYSSNYYYNDHDHRLDQGERLERRDNIRQGASSRPTGSAAASRNMGRPSGGGMRGGGGRGGGGRR